MFGWIKNAALRRLAVTAVRHGLNALGVYLISKGYTTEADWTSIAIDVSPILVALVWSILEKSNGAKKVDVALALPAGSTHDDLKDAMASDRAA